MLDERVGDGNDRLSFTGERHGTAAPVGPEGQRGYAFDATARTVLALDAQEPWLARMAEEHDDVVLGLVLDAYATEYHHPGSHVMSGVVADLTAHRGAGQRRALARSLLLLGYRFGAVHLEERDPAPGQVLALASGQHLAAAVQRRILEHVRGGGGLVHLGPLPERDLDGSPCTLLAYGLGLMPGDLLLGSERYFPSTVPRGWLAPGPETRVSWRQRLTLAEGDVLLTDVGGAVCGVAVSAGAGHAVVIATDLPADRTLFGRVLEHLGARPGVTTDAPWPGIITTTTATPDGQRALHLLNHAGRAMDVRVCVDGVPLHDGERLRVPARSGHVLPLGLDVGGRRIAWASAEITAHDDASVTFGPGLDLDGGTTVVLGSGERVTGGPGGFTLRLD
jgi:beta-galactosidase